MSAVHGETGFNFNEVFELPVTDFLAYLAFINEKNARREAEVRKLKGQVRIA